MVPLRLSVSVRLVRGKQGLFNWQVRAKYFGVDWRVPRIVLV